MKRSILFFGFIVMAMAITVPLFAAGGAESKAPSDGKLELTIVYDYDIPDGAPITKAIEEAFNVKLNTLNNKGLSTAENKQKMQLMVASGDKIDVFVAYDYNMLSTFAQQGVIAEVPRELIQKEAPRMYNYLMKIQPGAFAFSTVNGKNYGFPTAWPLGNHSRVMSIRVDWLEKMGMEIPTTLSDLEKALYAFRNNDPDGNGVKDTYGFSFYNTPGNVQMFAAIYGAFGAHPQIFQVKNGELVYGSTLPETKEALTLLNKWYKEGIIDPSFFVDNYTVFQEKWINSKFGLIPDTWWWTAGPSVKYYSGALYDPLVKANPAAKPTTIGPVTGPRGDIGMRQRNVMEVIPMIVFGKHLEQDQTKMRRWFQIWDELLSTEKWSVFLYHGDEGITYKKDAQGYPEWLPPYDTMEKRNEYGMNYFSVAPNYDIYDTATKDGAWIEQERAKAIGPMDAIAGYPLESWKKYKVNLDTIEEKAFISFITGARPLSEFDSFVNEWMSSGGKDVLEEARKVYKEKFAK